MAISLATYTTHVPHFSQKSINFPIIVHIIALKFINQLHPNPLKVSPPFSPGPEMWSRIHYLRYQFSHHVLRHPAGSKLDTHKKKKHFFILSYRNSIENLNSLRHCRQPHRHHIKQQQQQQQHFAGTSGPAMNRIPFCVQIQ